MSYPADLSKAKFYLASNQVAFEYDRATNQRTEKVVGARFSVVDVNNAYEPLNVLVEGAPSLLFDTENGAEIPPSTEVVFDGLVARPYVGRNGRSIAYSAKATAVRLAQPQRGKAE